MSEDLEKLPPAGPTPDIDPHAVELKRERKRGFRIAMIIVAVLGVLLYAATIIPCMVPARTTAQKNACIANLKQIDGAIQHWALENHKRGSDAVTTIDILEYLKGSTLPACPLHGVYGVSTVSSTPTCTMSAKGHSL